MSSRFLFWDAPFYISVLFPVIRTEYKRGKRKRRMKNGLQHFSNENIVTNAVATMSRIQMMPVISDGQP